MKHVFITIFIAAFLFGCSNNNQAEREKLKEEVRAEVEAEMAKEFEEAMNSDEMKQWKADQKAHSEWVENLDKQADKALEEPKVEYEEHPVQPLPENKFLAAKYPKDHLIHNKDIKPMKLATNQERIDWLKIHGMNNDGSFRSLVKVIKDMLHDDTSFRHQKTTYEYWVTGNCVSIDMVYRAKNQFGAYQIGDQRMIVDFDLNQIRLETAEQRQQRLQMKQLSNSFLGALIEAEAEKQQKDK
jgi:hypothetical protein